MALDGFSMGNLGLPNEITSAQMANQAEQLAQRDAEIKIKDVSEMAEKHGIKRKEDDSESNQFFDGFKKKQDDEGEDEGIDDSIEEFTIESRAVNNLNEKDLERNPKEFSIRINPETEMVELYSTKQDRVLETISPKDLMGLLSKLDGASGILVNRKI